MATACLNAEEHSSTSDFPMLRDLTMSGMPVLKRCRSLTVIENGTCHLNRTTVFDLRCVQRFAKAKPANFAPTKESKEHTTEMIARQFNAKETNVSIFELENSNSHNLNAFILPDFVIPGNQTVVIDMYDSPEKSKPDQVCTRLHDRANITELQELIVNEFGWKSVSICKNGRVVDCNVSVKSLALDGLIRLQALKPCKREVHVVFQPKPRVSYVYAMELDMTCQVSALKQSFLKDFADDLLIRIITEIEMIHLFRHDMPLDDQTCIGILLAGSKDRTLQMHIASRDAICVTLHYREEKGRTKVQRYQQVSVKPNCSTSDLRAEAAKYLKADPKSIKLTVDSRRVEEDADLQASGILKKGIVLNAGTKKRKTLQIRHPVTKEEISVKLYMLETVLLLKQEIARQLALDEFHISLWCKGVEMSDDENLLNYPIKNHMELAMTIHRHRISFWINILFKQTKVKLVVDDAMITSVADVLQYCAIRYGYSHRFSRAVFQHRCLRSDSSLADAGLCHDSTVYICFFDEPDEQLGEFIRAFEVRPDGQANPRIATVCQGHLCYAPDGITLPAVETTNARPVLTETPHGLHAESEIKRPAANYRTDDKDASITVSNSRSTPQSKVFPNKAKYLRRARLIVQRRTDREQTIRKLSELSDYQLTLVGRQKTTLKQNDERDGFMRNGHCAGKEQTGMNTLTLRCNEDMAISNFDARTKSDQEQTRKKLLLLSVDKGDEFITNADTIRGVDEEQIDTKSSRRPEEEQTKKKLIYSNDEITIAAEFSLYQKIDIEAVSEYRETHYDNKDSVLTAYLFGSGRPSTVQHVNNDHGHAHAPNKETEDTSIQRGQILQAATTVEPTKSYELNNLNSESPKVKAAAFKKNLSESSTYYTTDMNDSSSSQDQLPGSRRRSGYVPIYEANPADRRVPGYLPRLVPGRHWQLGDEVLVSDESSSMSEFVPVTLKVVNKPRFIYNGDCQNLPSVSERVSRQGGYKTV